MATRGQKNSSIIVFDTILLPLKHKEQKLIGSQFYEILHIQHVFVFSEL